MGAKVLGSGFSLENLENTPAEPWTMEEPLRGEYPYDRAPGVVDNDETRGLLMHSSFNEFTDGSMRAPWRTYARPNAKGNGVALLYCGN